MSRTLGTWQKIKNPEHIPLGDILYVSLQNTLHYSFKVFIHARCYNNICNNVYLYIGSPTLPCFSLSIPFIMDNPQVANMCNVKRIRECLNKDVDDDTWEKYSFPVEAINKIIEILHSQFPSVKFIKLEDESHIECSYNPLDKLDLLYYSVALYGKSWYEKNFDAYFIPRDKFIDYKCKSKELQTLKKKQSIPFDTIEKLIIDKGSDYAYNMLRLHNNDFRNMYEQSDTIPEFFLKLSKFIPKNDKCLMFKEWIKHFVIKHVGEIDRKWVIDVYSFTITQHGGRRTRKRKSNQRMLERT
jgi:hypothetical protein